jgi:hypothetical protein
VPGDITDLGDLKGPLEVVFLVGGHEGRADLHEDQHEDCEDDGHDGRLLDVQQDDQGHKDAQERKIEEGEGLSAALKQGLFKQELLQRRQSESHEGNE